MPLGVLMVEVAIRGDFFPVHLWYEEVVVDRIPDDVFVGDEDFGIQFDVTLLMSSVLAMARISSLQENRVLSFLAISETAIASMVVFSSD